MMLNRQIGVIAQEQRVNLKLKHTLLSRGFGYQNQTRRDIAPPLELPNFQIHTNEDGQVWVRCPNPATHANKPWVRLQNVDGFRYTEFIDNHFGNCCSFLPIWSLRRDSMAAARERGIEYLHFFFSHKIRCSLVNTLGIDFIASFEFEMKGGEKTSRELLHAKCPRCDKLIPLYEKGNGYAWDYFTKHAKICWLNMS